MKVGLFLGLLLLTTSLASALELTDDSTISGVNIIPVVVTFNNATASVNNSQFLQGLTPAQVAALTDLSGYRTLDNNTFNWLNITNTTAATYIGGERLLNQIRRTNCDSDAIAWWRMEGNALDNISNHDGDSFPGTTSGNPGLGSVASFSFGDPITIENPSGDLALSNSQGFTIEFWFKGFYGPPAEIINQSNYKINWVVDNSFNDFNHIEATVNGVTLNGSSLNLNNDIDYHVALTRDSSNILKLYIDGVLINQTSGVSTPSSNTNSLRIAGEFIGIIDELILYSHTSDPLTTPSQARVTRDYTKSSLGHPYCDDNEMWNLIGNETNFYTDINFNFFNLTNVGFINGINISDLGGGLWSEVSGVATYDGKVNITGNTTIGNTKIIGEEQGNVLSRMNMYNETIGTIVYNDSLGIRMIIGDIAPYV